MYIIALGWLFVALLASITAGSVVAGILRFAGFMIPLLLLLWLLGTPTRRRRREQAAAASLPPDPPAR